jgi:hypothetical protein
LEDLARTGKLATFASLPVLRRLEAIGFHGGIVRTDDLRQLAALPRLQALDLTNSIVTDAALAELASLESLEELAIDNEVASAAVLESLLALKRLQALHIVSDQIDYSLAMLPLDHEGEMRVRESEVARCRRALEALRRSNPGIAIDSHSSSFDERRVWPGVLDGMQNNPWVRRWPPGEGSF